MPKPLLEKDLKVFEDEIAIPFSFIIPILTFKDIQQIYNQKFLKESTYSENPRKKQLENRSVAPTMIQKLVDHEIESINLDVGLSIINFEKIPVFVKSTNSMSTSIYIGTLSDQSLVAAKVFTAADGNLSLEDVNAIQNEATILIIASNCANKDNCFIQFFGEEADGKSIYLFMEAHNHNLMDLILYWKSINFRLGQDTLDKWIISLVHSFAGLNNLKITHGDIKPHNIIVTDGWELKIIDFGISNMRKEIDETIGLAGTYLIQGSRGYMAPELEEMLDSGIKSGNYMQEKANVFSLGMTILQIITYEDLSSLNMKQYNRQLLGKVADLEVSEWIKNMLTGMFALDRAHRFSFNQCTRFLPSAGTSLA